MQNQQQQMQELDKWMAYVNYGQFTHWVKQQALQFLQAYPLFKPTVESMQLPGTNQPSNLLMFKGAVSVQVQNPMPKIMQFPLKIILVNSYPSRAPKVYIDQQLPAAVVKNKQYLGAQNEVQIPYLTGWNMSNQPNIKDLMCFLESVIKSDPPILSHLEGSTMYGQFQQPSQQQMPSTDQQYQQQNPHAMFNPQGQFGAPQQMQQKGATQLPQANMNMGQNAGGDQHAKSQEKFQKKTQLLDKVDIQVNDLTLQTESTLNNLINMKTHLQNNSVQIDANLQNVEIAMKQADQQLQSLQTSHASMKNIVSQNSNPQAQPDQASLSDMITAEDPVSEKIILILAKYRALEDCLGGLKKGFEKEAIPLDDYLKHVRQISSKQCKQLIKMNKLREALRQR